MQHLAAPWPDNRTLLAVDRTSFLNLGRRIRVALAQGRSRHFRHLLDATVIRCPWVHTAMKHHPILFRPLISKFLDVRADCGRRFADYAWDLEFTSTRINQSCPGFFPLGLRQQLWSEPDHGYLIELTMNLTHPQEGLWKLSIRTADSILLFSISFSVLRGPMLFIGSVQGGRSSNTVNMAERIRSATKHCEGLRPHFLLMDALRTLAAAWRVRSLVGISTLHQLSAQSNRRLKDPIRFSYDNYWREMNAALRRDGNWNVPLTHRERLAEEAPSRKRAMYRRRAELLQGMHRDLNCCLAIPPSA